MEQNESYYPELITRYLWGEATPEEIRELSGWLQGDPAHTALFEELQKSWLLLEEARISEQTDLKLEWTALQRKLGGTVAQADPVMQVFKPVDQELQRHTVTEAQRHTVTKAQRHTVTEAQRHTVTKAQRHTVTEAQRDTVTEAQRHRIPDIPLSGPLPDSTFSRKGSDWRILAIRIAAVAAILLVLLIPAWMIVNYVTQDKVNRITASGEMMETTLPDGTTVTLNAGSWVIVPDGFGRTARQVELQGQAYFEVVHDPTMPMVITSGNARVEVKGTSFYVNAPNTEVNLEVVLVDGSVALSFTGTGDSATTIAPGERAELVRSQQEILVTPNDDPNFLAWKTHRIIFFDDRLDKIVQTLNNVYQSNIVLATGDLATCRMTATFNRQSLESVIRVIEATLDLQAESTDTGITLSGKGCP